MRSFVWLSLLATLGCSGSDPPRRLAEIEAQLTLRLTVDDSGLDVQPAAFGCLALAPTFTADVDGVLMNVHRGSGAWHADLQSGAVGNHVCEDPAEVTLSHAAGVPAAALDEVHLS